MMGQSSSSLALSVIKTEVPLDCDDRASKDLLLQQYGERIEKLSQQDKLSKFCMDAGFLNVVENGQYFMTNDTGDLTQFNTVACREYTLPREDEASQPKGWIQGNTKIGPVVEGLSGWTWPRSSARPSFFLSVDRKDKADVLVLDRFLASLHRSQELLLVGRTAWAALWAVSKVVAQCLAGSTSSPCSFQQSLRVSVLTAPRSSESGSSSPPMSRGGPCRGSGLSGRLHVLLRFVSHGTDVHLVSELILSPLRPCDRRFCELWRFSFEELSQKEKARGVPAAGTFDWAIQPQWEGVQGCWDTPARP